MLVPAGAKQSTLSVGRGSLKNSHIRTGVAGKQRVDKEELNSETTETSAFDARDT
jgi:hypothetical protein